MAELRACTAEQVRRLQCWLGVQFTDCSEFGLGVGTGLDAAQIVGRPGFISHPRMGPGRWGAATGTRLGPRSDLGSGSVSVSVRVRRTARQSWCVELIMDRHGAQVIELGLRKSHLLTRTRLLGRQERGGSREIERMR